ncbi:MAG: hypothetical protein NT007_01165 [Candidatus Kapabacteria bacterium]|nr:hypothetical protein [Candidatus Kapabacteria bacterium]
MKIRDISLKLFQTDLFNASYLSKKYHLFDDKVGFEKNRNYAALFSGQGILKYLHKYQSLTIIALTLDEYAEFKKSSIPHQKFKETNTILEFTKDYFTNLTGKTNKPIRSIVNKFSKRLSVRMQTNLNSDTDFYEFIKTWGILRKERHHMLCTGYDKNFFEKYLRQNSDNLFGFYFYHKGSLIGFSIIEHVSDNLFNLLFRKSNTEFNGLTQYIDYCSFKSIAEKFNSDIIVNMGSDMGDKYLLFNKTHSFNVETLEIITYKIRIKNEDKK